MSLVLRSLIFALLIGFGVWCYRQFHSDLGRISLVHLGRRWDVLLVAGALSVWNYVLRIWRWDRYMVWLGYEVPWRRNVLYYTAGFAFTLSPAKVGELMRARFYAAHEVPLTKVAGAFFVERLLDILAILGLASLGLVTDPGLHGFLWIALAAVVGGGAMFAFVPWSRVERWSTASGRWLPKPLGKLIRGIARACIASRRLLMPRMLAFGLSLSIVSWGAEGTGLWMLSDLSPVGALDWADAVGIYAVATLLGALSFLPGGLGGTEAVMIAVLVSTKGYPVADAVLITLVCRLLTLWLSVILGWGAAGVSRLGNPLP